MAKSASTTATGTKMAAAFPGLQDRLEHFTSELVIIPAEVVEAEKLEDEVAEAPIPPNVVEERPLPESAAVDELCADESWALPATDGVLVDDGVGVELVEEPEL